MQEGQLTAVAATHQGAGSIRITIHPAKKTDRGLMMQDDNELVLVADVDDGIDAIVTVVEPEHGALINEIAKEVRTDLWSRLAGYGIL
jgi:hypothetical protein